MFHLNKQKIVIVFVLCLFLSATKVLACECSILSIEDAVEKSTMVFSGKVVGFEYRKDISNQFMELREKHSGKHIGYETKVIKFQVERWWKGKAPSEAFLITSSTRNADGTTSRSSCDYNFVEGESYLIYAFGKQSELRTNFCRRTRLLSKAQEDLKILGEGKEPLKSKDEPNKPIDVRARAATLLSRYSFNLSLNVAVCSMLSQQLAVFAFVALALI